jgi:hypothetical protein
MRIALAQYDNRSPEQLGHFLHLMHMNREYARHHGYDYRFESIVEGGHEMPPYWRKVVLIRNLLRSGYDCAMWLDTDAVICDPVVRIEFILAEPAVFAYSRDMPIFAYVQKRADFNAGAFICSRGALPILDYWLSLYDPGYWVRDASGADTWTCTHGEWAGIAFEQEQFCINVIPRFQGPGLLQQMPWRFFQSPWPMAGSFVLHFPTIFKHLALQYLLRDEV